MTAPMLAAAALTALSTWLAPLSLGLRPLPPGLASEDASEAGSPAEATDTSEAGFTQVNVADSAPAQVADVVLACGLRVIAAKDASLPVAAVVLSIEVGTRDDPDKLPGLVHALAYHLQQGNRELGPGEAIAAVHDVGGLAGMAVGPAQIRFESLIPISQLDTVLRAESLRLRAPNTGRELWLKSLSYARNDDAEALVIPREATAAAWNDAGLAHDGRVVGQALGDMLDQALGAQMARLFDYRNATLVVVGPDDPQALIARVEPMFADLGARPRKPITPATPPAVTASGGPRVVRIDRQNGDTLVWAVPGQPQARAWAQVLCGTLNRQTRGADEPAKARVRCTYDDDPRRPALILRAIAFDPAVGPEPMIAARLARIAAAATEPELASLIEAQRRRIADDLTFALRAPLDLASYLSSASEQRPPGQAGLLLRPRAELVGLPELPGSGADAVTELVAAVPELLDTRGAVLLLGPDHPVPPPVHPPTQPQTDQPQPKPAQPQPAQPSADAPAEAPADQPSSEERP